MPDYKPNLFVNIANDMCDSSDSDEEYDVSEAPIVPVMKANNQQNYRFDFETPVAPISSIMTILAEDANTVPMSIRSQLEEYLYTSAPGLMPQVSESSLDGFNTPAQQHKAGELSYIISILETFDSLDALQQHNLWTQGLNSVVLMLSQIQTAQNNISRSLQTNFVPYSGQSTTLSEVAVNARYINATNSRSFDNRRSISRRPSSPLMGIEYGADVNQCKYNQRDRDRQYSQVPHQNNLFNLPARSNNNEFGVAQNNQDSEHYGDTLTVFGFRPTQ